MLKEARLPFDVGSDSIEESESPLLDPLTADAWKETVNELHEQHHRHSLQLSAALAGPFALARTLLLDSATGGAHASTQRVVVGHSSSSCTVSQATVRFMHLLSEQLQPCTPSR